MPLDFLRGFKEVFEWNATLSDKNTSKTGIHLLRIEWNCARMCAKIVELILSNIFLKQDLIPCQVTNCIVRKIGKRLKTLKSILHLKRPQSTTYPARWGDDTWPSYGAWWCGSVLSFLHWLIHQPPPLDRRVCSQRPECDWVRDAMSHWVCSFWLWLSAQLEQRSLKRFGKEMKKLRPRITHANINTNHLTSLQLYSHLFLMEKSTS